MNNGVTEAVSSPLVSVIIPAYNSERYLSKTIASVLNQTFRDVEIIVIDDGSTDGTAQIAQAFGGVVRYIHQVNQGSAVARSEGIRQAKGDYIAFLDADDLWMPAKLERQVAYLQQHPEIGAVYSRWLIKDTDALEAAPLETTNPLADVVSNSQLSSSTLRSGWIYSDLLFDAVVWTSVVMMRRSVCLEVGDFDATFKRGQDYDYWLRASQITQFHQLPDVLAIYRIHPESISHNEHQRNYEYEVVSSAIGRFGTKSPGGVVPRAHIRKRLLSLCLGFAYMKLAQGYKPQARKHAFEALKVSMFAVKAYWYVIKSYL